MKFFSHIMMGPLLFNTFLQSLWPFLFEELKPTNFNLTDAVLSCIVKHISHAIKSLFVVKH